MIWKENENVLFPNNLAINYCPILSKSLIKKLSETINLAFDSFFYNIFISEWLIEEERLCGFSKKASIGKHIQRKETILVYPTNLFYNSMRELSHVPNNSRLKLGITDLPLYSSTNEDLLFLYGEAHIDLKSAVVSTYNLHNNQTNSSNKGDIVEKRIIKECVHELGHLILGGDHCINTDCVMNYSNNLEDVDKKSALPCGSCQDKLELIRENYNF